MKYEQEYLNYVEGELLLMKTDLIPHQPVKTYTQWLEERYAFLDSAAHVMGISYEWNKRVLSAHESTVRCIRHILNGKDPTFYEIKQFITLLDAHIEEINEEVYQKMENNDETPTT